VGVQKAVNAGEETRKIKIKTGCATVFWRWRPWVVQCTWNIWLVIQSFLY